MIGHTALKKPAILRALGLLGSAGPPPPVTPIAFLSSGAAASGLSSATPAYPADVASGQMLILFVVAKYITVAVAPPAGWTLLGSFTGGIMTGSGAGSGEGVVWAYYRIANGTETPGATINVGVSPAANCSHHKIFSFTKDASKTWSIAFTGGNMQVPATAWSVTGASWNVAANDFLVQCTFQNSYVTVSAQAMTMAGVTFGAATEQYDLGSTAGDDVRMIVSTHPVTAGGATGATTYTALVAGTTSPSSPTGATLMVRLRQV